MQTEPRTRSKRRHAADARSAREKQGGRKRPNAPAGRHAWLISLGVMLALGAQVSGEGPFDAAQRARMIAPYLDEQTIAVGHVDLDRIAINQLVKEFLPAIDAEFEWLATMRQAQAALIGSGVREIYVVASLADLPENPPFMIAPLPDGTNADGLMRTMPAKLAESRRMRISRLNQALFIGGHSSFSRLDQLQADERPELVAAFEAAGDTAAQLLILPTPRDRRVIEEVLGKLPEEVGGGPVTILTHGLVWAAIGADPPPNVSLHSVIQSRDPDAARALRDKWVQALQLLAARPDVRAALGRVNEAVELFSPAVEKDRLVLSFDSKRGNIEALARVLRPQTEKAAHRVWRVRTSNNLKHIAIAMHNWHDVHRSFPAQANYDASGKPLLSWRVHILPFVEQQRLYEQFHLDEPWDSDHNRKLIDQMPDVYRSPASRLRQKGRSSYLLPIGRQTAFPGKEGLTFRDITDGTSNTIMVVEVDDEHAVIWTKPEDLAYDPRQPATGLGGLFEGGFHAALCDGSVQFLKLPHQPDRLRALFSRAGGEAIGPEE